MYVCLCKAITDGQIRAAVADGAHTFQKVAQQTGCGTQCGQCACMAKEIVDETLAEAGVGLSLFHAA